MRMKFLHQAFRIVQLKAARRCRHACICILRRRCPLLRVESESENTTRVHVTPCRHMTPRDATFPRDPRHHNSASPFDSTLPRDSTSPCLHVTLRTHVTPHCHVTLCFHVTPRDLGVFLQAEGAAAAEPDV